jgi:hypothetical protein
MEVAVAHEVVEDGPTGVGTETKQPGGLIQMQTQPGHLAIRSDDHRNELRWCGLAVNCTGAAPVLMLDVTLHITLLRWCRSVQLSSLPGP